MVDHKLDAIAQQDENKNDIDLQEIEKSLRSGGVLSHPKEIQVLVEQLNTKEHELEYVLSGTLRQYLEEMDGTMLTKLYTGEATKEQSKLFQFACRILFAPALTIDGDIGPESKAYLHLVATYPDAIRFLMEQPAEEKQRILAKIIPLIKKSEATGIPLYAVDGYDTLFADIALKRSEQTKMFENNLNYEHDAREVLKKTLTDITAIHDLRMCGLKPEAILILPEKRASLKTPKDVENITSENISEYVTIPEGLSVQMKSLFVASYKNMLQYILSYCPGRKNMIDAKPFSAGSYTFERISNKVVYYNKISRRISPDNVAEMKRGKLPEEYKNLGSDEAKHDAFLLFLGETGAKNLSDLWASISPQSETAKELIRLEGYGGDKLGGDRASYIIYQLNRCVEGGSIKLKEDGSIECTGTLNRSEAKGIFPSMRYLTATKLGGVLDETYGQQEQQKDQQEQYEQFIAGVKKERGLEGLPKERDADIVNLYNQLQDAKQAINTQAQKAEAGWKNYIATKLEQEYQARLKANIGNPYGGGNIYNDLYNQRKAEFDASIQQVAKPQMESICKGYSNLLRSCPADKRPEWFKTDKRLRKEKNPFFPVEFDYNYTKTNDQVRDVGIEKFRSNLKEMYVDIAAGRGRKHLPQLAGMVAGIAAVVITRGQILRLVGSIPTAARMAVPLARVFLTGSAYTAGQLTGSLGGATVNGVIDGDLPKVRKDASGYFDAEQKFIGAGAATTKTLANIVSAGVGFTVTGPVGEKLAAMVTQKVGNKGLKRGITFAVDTVVGEIFLEGLALDPVVNTLNRGADVYLGFGDATPVGRRKFGVEDANATGGGAVPVGRRKFGVTEVVAGEGDDKEEGSKYKSGSFSDMFSAMREAFSQQYTAENIGQVMGQSVAFSATMKGMSLPAELRMGRYNAQAAGLENKLSGIQNNADQLAATNIQLAEQVKQLQAQLATSENADNTQQQITELMSQIHENENRMGEMLLETEGVMNELLAVMMKLKNADAGDPEDEAKSRRLRATMKRHGLEKEKDPELALMKLAYHRGLLIGQDNETNATTIDNMIAEIDELTQQYKLIIEERDSSSVSETTSPETLASESSASEMSVPEAVVESAADYSILPEAEVDAEMARMSEQLDEAEFQLPTETDSSFARAYRNIAESLLERLSGGNRNPQVLEQFRKFLYITEKIGSKSSDWLQNTFTGTLLHRIYVRMEQVKGVLHIESSVRAFIYALYTKYIEVSHTVDISHKRSSAIVPYHRNGTEEGIPVYRDREGNPLSPEAAFDASKAHDQAIAGLFIRSGAQLGYALKSADPHTDDNTLQSDKDVAMNVESAKRLIDLLIADPSGGGMIKELRGLDKTGSEVLEINMKNKDALYRLAEAGLLKIVAKVEVDGVSMDHEYFSENGRNPLDIFDKYGLHKGIPITVHGARYMSYTAAVEYVRNVLKMEKNLMETGTEEKGKMSKRIINLIQLAKSDNRHLPRYEKIFQKVKLLFASEFDKVARASQERKESALREVKVYLVEEAGFDADLIDALPVPGSQSERLPIEPGFALKIRALQAALFAAKTTEQRKEVIQEIRGLLDTHDFSTRTGRGYFVHMSFLAGSGTTFTDAETGKSSTYDPTLVRENADITDDTERVSKIEETLGKDLPLDAENACLAAHYYNPDSQAVFEYDITVLKTKMEIAMGKYEIEDTAEGPRVKLDINKKPIPREKSADYMTVVEAGNLVRLGLLGMSLPSVLDVTKNKFENSRISKGLNYLKQVEIKRLSHPVNAVEYTPVFYDIGKGVSDLFVGSTENLDDALIASIFLGSEISSEITQALGRITIPSLKNTLTQLGVFGLLAKMTGLEADSSQSSGGRNSAMDAMKSTEALLAMLTGNHRILLETLYLEQKAKLKSKFGLKESEILEYEAKRGQGKRESYVNNEAVELLRRECKEPDFGVALNNKLYKAYNLEGKAKDEAIDAVKREFESIWSEYEKNPNDPKFASWKKRLDIAFTLLSGAGIGFESSQFTLERQKAIIRSHLQPRGKNMSKYKILKDAGIVKIQAFVLMDNEVCGMRGDEKKISPEEVFDMVGGKEQFIDNEPGGHCNGLSLIHLSRYLGLSQSGDGSNIETQFQKSLEEGKKKSRQGGGIVQEGTHRGPLQKDITVAGREYAVPNSNIVSTLENSMSDDTYNETTKLAIRCRISGVSDGASPDHLNYVPAGHMTLLVQDPADARYMVFLDYEPIPALYGGVRNTGLRIEKTKVLEFIENGTIDPSTIRMFESPVATVTTVPVHTAENTPGDTNTDILSQDYPGEGSPLEEYNSQKMEFKRRLEYRDTMQTARQVLGDEKFAQLSVAQRHAIRLAHVVGYMEEGKDGKTIGLDTAGINKDGTTNYKKSQLGRKLNILEAAGFDKDTRAMLVREGVCGLKETNTTIEYTIGANSFFRNDRKKTVGFGNHPGDAICFIFTVGKFDKYEESIKAFSAIRNIPGCRFSAITSPIRFSSDEQRTKEDLITLLGYTGERDISSELETIVAQQPPYAKKQFLERYGLKPVISASATNNSTANTSPHRVEALSPVLLPLNPITESTNQVNPSPESGTMIADTVFYDPSTTLVIANLNQGFGIQHASKGGIKVNTNTNDTSMRIADMRGSVVELQLLKDAKYFEPVFCEQQFPEGKGIGMIYKKFDNQRRPAIGQFRCITQNADIYNSIRESPELLIQLYTEKFPQFDEIKKLNAVYDMYRFKPFNPNIVPIEVTYNRFSEPTVKVSYNDSFNLKYESFDETTNYIDASKEGMKASDRKSWEEYSLQNTEPNRRMEYRNTMQKARQVLGAEKFAQLSAAQRHAIWLAHIVGYMEEGTDGKTIGLDTAGINKDGTTNYKPGQLGRKLNILEAAGFDKDTRAMLVREGVCGITNVLKNAGEYFKIRSNYGISLQNFSRICENYEWIIVVKNLVSSEKNTPRQERESINLLDNIFGLGDIKFRNVMNLMAVGISFANPSSGIGISGNSLKIEDVPEVVINTSKLEVLKLLTQTELPGRVMNDILNDTLSVDYATHLVNIAKGIEEYLGHKLEYYDSALQACESNGWDIETYMNEFKSFKEKTEGVLEYEVATRQAAINVNEYQYLDIFTSLKLRFSDTEFSDFVDIIQNLQHSSSGEIRNLGYYIANVCIKNKSLSLNEVRKYISCLEVFFETKHIPMFYKNIVIDNIVGTSTSDAVSGDALFAEHTNMQNELIFSDMRNAIVQSNSKELRKYLTDMLYLETIISKVEVSGGLTSHEASFFLEHIDKVSDILSDGAETINLVNKLSGSPQEIFARIKELLPIQYTGKDLVRIVCQKVLGIDSIEDVLNDMNTFAQATTERHRSFIRDDKVIFPSDVPLRVRGVYYDTLHKTWQEGLLSPELFGADIKQKVDARRSNMTPGDIDGVTVSDISTISKWRYGDGVYLVTLQDERIASQIIVPGPGFRGDGGQSFRGIRNALGSGQIDCILLSQDIIQNTEKLESIKSMIVEQGFYTPIVDEAGNVLFSFDERERAFP